MKRTIIRNTIFGNAIVWLLVLLFFLFTVFQTLSNTIYDYDIKHSMSHMPHEDIIVIGIDEDSLKEIGKFPWDRKTYIPFLQQTAGAKVVAFDIMFNTESAELESDLLFAEALKKHGKVILATSLITETDLKKSMILKSGQPLQPYGLNKPIPILAEAVQLGHIYRDKDEDGVLRRTHLMVESPEQSIYSLAYQAVTMYGADINAYLESVSKTKQLSKSPKTEQLIRYNADSSEFFYIPFNKVDEMDPEIFTDRIVLVGSTAAGDDVGTTPVDNTMYLVYAHANIIDQLLNGQEPALASDVTILILTILLLLITAGLTWRLKSIASIVYLFGVTVILLVAQYMIFRFYELFVDPIYPLVGLYAAFLINIAIKTFYETKQKNYITKQFGRYISPDLVKEISKSGQEIQLGGINKELSILFLDVRGFTTLTERLKPEEVVGFLNMMFNLITEKALENHGTIDKFIGDAAMILFNAPLDVPNHEYYAVKTAYDIQKGMEAVRQQIQDTYGVSISVGIGVNTGEVVVGNIGSYLRVDYTAIGDNVNTAARIESNTVANQILVSEVTYERTLEHFEYGYVGEKMMKGKTVALKLFEVKSHLKAYDETV
ncbi:MAG: adenylate/guanylate cyclase domain-containing protein [Paenibacillaceae bacterium]